MKKDFTQSWKFPVLLIALLLVVTLVPFVYAGQLKNPGVVGNTNKSVDKSQLKPEATNALVSLDNATGANTAVDLGALSKDLFCVAYLSNASGVITGLAAADTASITVQGSVEGTSGPGWYTLGSFSLTNSVVSTITNTTLMHRYLRANITAIGNASSYINMSCGNRGDW